MDDKKACTKCGVEYPATREHFTRHSARKDGLSTLCMSCDHERHARYHANNLEKIHEKARRWRQENREFLIEKQKKWREKSPRKWAVKDMKRYLEVSYKWKRDNPDKCREIERRYRQSHIEHRRVLKVARIARKRNLPNTLTTLQWQRALEYFNGCCAVCGRQLKDLFSSHTAAADHWIPVSRGGATVASNIVPLCHGQGGCNNRKHDRDAIEFLETKFGKRNAKHILARINTYFQTLLDAEHGVAENEQI